jgi:hypothetical protein
MIARDRSAVSRTLIILGVAIALVRLPRPWITGPGSVGFQRHFGPAGIVHRLRAGHDRHSREHSSLTEPVGFFAMKVEAVEA